MISTIRITLGRQNGVPTGYDSSIQAVQRGVWAAHPRAGTSDLSDWVVTHVPSGLGIPSNVFHVAPSKLFCGSLTCEEAIAVVFALETTIGDVTLSFLRTPDTLYVLQAIIGEALDSLADLELKS